MQGTMNEVIGGFVSERDGPEPLVALELGALTPPDLAFFLDFDGTLADFADDPAAVAIPEEIRTALARLHDAAGGAVAVVSGRPIGDLDRMLQPLRLPLAGVHGLEWRIPSGAVRRAGFDARALGSAARLLAEFAAANPGTFLEEKPGAVALHYRRRPELAGEALALARTAAERSGLSLMHGKMVLELKDSAVTKAHAISRFMSLAPFAGRRPLYAGDDVTDEDAFRSLSGTGAITIKVGPGETAARFRACDIDEFRNWLVRLAAHVNGCGSPGARRAGGMSPAR